jgi:predicted RNase H-like HicB family nuclease
MKRRYLIVLEETSTGYSTFAPDLPGCIAVGSTRDEAAANMRDAVDFHVFGLRDEGMPVPEPTSTSDYVEV